MQVDVADNGGKALDLFVEAFDRGEAFRQSAWGKGADAQCSLCTSSCAVLCVSGYDLVLLDVEMVLAGLAVARARSADVLARSGSL
jgi:hypothetical protein